jgi:hypothetical protein
MAGFVFECFMIDELSGMIVWVKKGELLLCVVEDFALRQRFLQFSNLCLGEVGVICESQFLRLRELFQALRHLGQLFAEEIQRCNLLITPTTLSDAPGDKQPGGRVFNDGCG